MAINSKIKGKKGELELSHLLREYGFDTHRSSQYCGKGGESADIVRTSIYTLRSKTS